MKKLHFSIVIKAPKEKVWHAMLDDKPYREWTKAFSPGSYYKGDWSKGSKILFLGPDPKTGEEGGMVSRIAENRPYEFISIEHLGIVINGVEDTTSEAARKWAPAFENYTFIDKDGATEVLAEMEIEEENVEEFEKMWPEALKELKAIAEQSNKMNPVVHFEMPYEDPNRLAKFYTEAFGWQMQKLGEDMGDYVLASTTETDENQMIKTPGAINGGFFPKKPDWPAQYPSVVIAVDDINEAMKKVSEAGGTVLGEPMEIPGIGQYVAFTDTEGNRVGMLEPTNM